MRSLLAFIKKEITYQLRSGKAMILGIVFVIFGIMNPAVAKLTPWIMEMFAETLAESGMTVTAFEVSALDSWIQFYKNIPMALIAFVIAESSIFTEEYETGTLLLSLTKGLERYKVVLSKTVVLLALWTVGYWLCFGITYGYNAYFWDNSVANSLGFSALCSWLFGVLAVSLTLFFSTLVRTGASVILSTGGVVIAFYIVGALPGVGKYLPTMLTDGNSLICGAAEPEKYLTSVIITVAVSIACLAVSIPLFNKKQL